jgi:hypothetical protein
MRGTISPGAAPGFADNANTASNKTVNDKAALLI